jgi:hypothetical protein
MYNHDNWIRNNIISYLYIFPLIFRRGSFFLYQWTDHDTETMAENGWFGLWCLTPLSAIF